MHKSQFPSPLGICLRGVSCGLQEGQNVRINHVPSLCEWGFAILCMLQIIVWWFFFSCIDFSFS
jgi:hypothetical protein